MSKEKSTEKKKKSNWFQNTLLGLVIFICGILLRFFPQIVSSILFIAFGIILLFVGITDGIAALKYKDNDDDWKTPMAAGVMSIVISLLFIGAAYWLKLPNAEMNKILLIAVAVWGILRCLVLLYGIFKGSVKRNGSIISALITGVGGILILIFRNAITFSGNVIGYLLIAIGAAVVFFGLYQRADAREKKEKLQRDKIAQTAAEEALKSAGQKEAEKPAEEKEKAEEDQSK